MRKGQEGDVAGRRLVMILLNGETLNGTDVP